MKKILLIGSTVADIIINLDHLPTTSADVNIVSQEMSLGGCAYNVSNMIHLFEVPYRLFSPVGTGLYGDFVRNQLAAKGLASPCRRLIRPTAAATALSKKAAKEPLSVITAPNISFIKNGLIR